MYKINIKPLSLNSAYRGRRYATNNLKTFKYSLNILLPKIKIPIGKLSVIYEFGMSSKGSDVDNCIKAFQDCISEAYGFNDNRIYKLVVEKVDVKKGEEYISFKIQSYEKNSN